MSDKLPAKTTAEIRAEYEQMMVRAAIKVAILSFINQKHEVIPEDLQGYWDSLDAFAWAQHLKYFKQELKTYKQQRVKELLLDLDNYIIDCKRLVPAFNRSREEVLLMVAIGQLDIKEFVGAFSQLPSNREKLDRKLHKELKLLDYADDLDLKRLDELTLMLDKPRIKKKEVDEIEKEISAIDTSIQVRKGKRESMAIKLVEWKARGNIDIADGKKFRLDA